MEVRGCPCVCASVAVLALSPSLRQWEVPRHEGVPPVFFELQARGYGRAVKFWRNVSSSPPYVPHAKGGGGAPGVVGLLRPTLLRWATQKPQLGRVPLQHRSTDQDPSGRRYAA